MKNFYLILLVFLFASSANAQQPIEFKGENIVIGKNVAVLEDATNKLNIDAVRKSSKFIPLHTSVPNLQLSRSNFWLKFTIKNESAGNQLLLNLEYPTLDICEFYYPVNGVYKSERLSDKYPFSQRKYKHQDFIFDINNPVDSTVTYYLKVQSGEEMVLPIMLGTPQKIAESKLTNDLLWGCLVGILLVMMFYNLFVYISTRDISYLYYVSYTLFIGLTQTTLSGYTYRFLFPNAPAAFNQCIIIFPALAGISLLNFSRSFLGVKERMPIMGYIFKIVIVFYLIAIVLRLLGYALSSYRAIDISALCLSVSIYVAVIRLSIKGFRPAKFFALAWTIFLAGLVLFVLRNLGVLGYNNFTNYTMQVGTAFEVTLLSLALADRINVFKAEKERSQEETLIALQENERIIREQNVMLELKVEERTHELNQSLEDLKQAQSQLVESEKMASLGQLTAGIAHEINNPINFVTSNINPLKRDVELVLEVINTIEQVSKSDASLADKQKQIEDYKEEVDFDYLVVEIRHLIKGIFEGATRTAEIVKGLKIFSRLDEDDLKRTNLNEGLDSTLVVANNLLNNRISIKKEFGELPLVECFAGKLNQVFLNLISNAIYAIEKKFGDSEGGEIKISTGIEDENVVIKIADNGIGMDDQIAKKVFEPFFTTKEVGEGTGLGMSIAYNTIKKHNGQIIVSSEPGKGTEFILKIPVIYDVKNA
ncbi:7TM diverse intracellular signaling domain-containing protein [Mucilaginibacter sp. UR6-11]|uniref:sensor histidine kinase n=1 Tax=Mucilaginibacter sp. UR6-11 TaxID=1435644 RepID=UPI001E2AF736|nr:7TM diverse intracellular signaling domain-containing protein [Mucilaginibacter sp. UR6-11]MCC8426837.1 sensor histidine kinase [Mucilaginibacter sp. UR6-11]